MRVFVFSCKKMYWTLPIYTYLMRTFWSEQQEIVVAGYETPDFNLPDNVTFHSIAPQTYPASEWSTGVIEFLESVEDEYFIWSLEDYWLVRGVNHAAIASLESYLACHPNVWRVDLTEDRLKSGGAVDCGYWGHLDMIETGFNVQYCLSTQMSVMSRRHALRILKPHLTPWQFELQDQRKALGSLRVMGTRNAPVRYTIGWGTGSVDEHGNQIPNTTNIPPQHLAFIKERGWLDERHWK